jgi:ribosomal subunit interface protein
MGRVGCRAPGRMANLALMGNNGCPFRHGPTEAPLESTQELDFTISTHGDVAQQEKLRVESKLTQLLEHVREPVLMADVRLIEEANRQRDRPAIAEATIVVNGAPVRAHVAAADMDAAIDLLCETLRRRLARHEQRLHRDGKERRSAGRADDDHEWRHGDLPTSRPEWYDRPAEEREMIRHKSFALDPMTTDEAAFDLDALAHDFYLFTELTTGADAMVSYDQSHGLVLQLPEGTGGEPLDGAATPAITAAPAPTLTLRAARERLEAGGERFVFFVDDDSGRGHVVYHRYDGHYGLITPAT